MYNTYISSSSVGAGQWKERGGKGSGKLVESKY